VTRDKLVIVLLIAVAVGLSVIGWWYRYQQGRRSLALWGGPSAQVIRNAPSAELWMLEPATEDGVGDFDQISDDSPREEATTQRQTLLIDGRRMRVVERIKLVPGDELTDVQKGLVQDRSFDWDRPRGECAPEWPYALRFVGAGEEVVIALDFTCQRVRLVAPSDEDETDREVSIAPIAAGLEKIVDEWIEKLGTARESAKPQAEGE